MKMSFGDDFNSRITGIVLPPGLRELYFGDRFNQAMTSIIIPPSLIYISLGIKFSRPLNVRESVTIHISNPLYLDRYI